MARWDPSPESRPSFAIRPFRPSNPFFRSPFDRFANQVSSFLRQATVLPLSPIFPPSFDHRYRSYVYGVCFSVLSSSSLLIFYFPRPTSLTTMSRPCAFGWDNLQTDLFLFMVNDLERREPLSGLHSVVHPMEEVAGVTTLQAMILRWFWMYKRLGVSGPGAWEGIRGSILRSPRAIP